MVTSERRRLVPDQCCRQHQVVLDGEANKFRERDRALTRELICGHREVAGHAYAQHSADGPSDTKVKLLIHAPIVLLG
jgi:hypothetical protein